MTNSLTDRLICFAPLPLPFQALRAARFTPARSFSTSMVARKDLIQDLYLSKLKEYKPPAKVSRNVCLPSTISALVRFRFLLYANLVTLPTHIPILPCSPPTPTFPPSKLSPLLKPLKPQLFLLTSLPSSPSSTLLSPPSPRPPLRLPRLMLPVPPTVLRLLRSTLLSWRRTCQRPRSTTKLCI